MGDIFDIYQRAWARVRRCVPVQYDVCPNREGAYFQHDDATGIPPIIIICTDGGFARDHPGKPSRTLASGEEASSERLLKELVSLAHEFGHWSSRNGRTPQAEWAKYREAEDRRGRRERITIADRERIVAEEALAWTIARELLCEVGLEEWDAFDRERSACLATYEQLPVAAHTV